MIKDLFPDLDHNESLTLQGTDYLVEAGIPRDRAEAILRRAFACANEFRQSLAKPLAEEFPDIQERTIVRALILRGIHEWLEDILPIIRLGQAAAMQQYNQGESNV